MSAILGSIEGALMAPPKIAHKKYHHKLKNLVLAHAGSRLAVASAGDALSLGFTFI